MSSTWPISRSVRPTCDGVDCGWCNTIKMGLGAGWLELLSVAVARAVLGDVVGLSSMMAWEVSPWWVRWSSRL